MRVLNLRDALRRIADLEEQNKRLQNEIVQWKERVRIAEREK
jgi:hypothetical protein